MDPLIIASAFVVGILVGLTGMGGGSVMTGLLILWFGVNPMVAVGTDLMFAAITKVTGAVVHHRSQNVNWRVVSLIVAGSLPAAAVTLVWLGWQDQDDPGVAAGIKLLIGAALIVAGSAIFFQRSLRGAARRFVPGRPGSPSRRALTVALGLIMGVVVTLCSVGAGAIGVAVLVALYPAMHARHLVGTDIAHAVPLTLVAGLGHGVIGTIDYLLLVNMLIGSLPGIYLGSRLTSVLPERVMFPLIAGLLVVVGVRLLIG